MVVSVATAATRAIKARRVATAAAQARPADAAQWPPIAVAPVRTTTAPIISTTADSVPSGGSSGEATDPTAPWVDPIDGACPVTHPVKGNGSSRIYHVPGGRFFDRTKPERCYRDPAAAEADGMRASKS